MWTDPGWLIFTNWKIGLDSDPWLHDLNFLYFSFSTLYSNSLWRTNTIVVSKLNKPPHFQISLPSPLSTPPPPSNGLEINSPPPRGGLNRGFAVSVNLPSPYRVFSHDVTTAILVSHNNKTAAMLVCPKPVLWEMNSFLMQTLSFVPINLHSCWPRE